MLTPMTKHCPGCDLDKSVDEFGVDRRRASGLNTYCRECVNAKAKAHRDSLAPGENSRYQMEYRKSTPERQAKWERSRRNTSFKTKYGITHDEWERLLVSQRNRCAICVSKFDVGDTKSIHVDHDHSTGQVRGLLCTTCNFLLGNAKDEVAILGQAIMYLKKSRIRKAS